MTSPSDKKVCSKCGKSDIEFYPHPLAKDGLLDKCKSCCKELNRQNYRDNLLEKKAYEESRRVSRRLYRLEQQRLHRSKHPEKYKARTAVGNAVRDGRLVRQGCKVCGKKAQAHHEDYSKPLEVKWFCLLHHRMEENRSILND